MKPIKAIASAAIMLAGLAQGAQARDRSWRFDVFLEDKPIGQQSFRLTEEGDRQRLVIDASFDVKILFFTVYAYRHHNEERWQNGCLARIRSTTDDNGESFRVEGEAHGAKFLVTTNAGRAELGACVRSFAYWNPKLLESTKLLNSQTGEHEPATLTLVGEETLIEDGKRVAATRYSLQGEKFRLELWYSPEGDWLALESSSKGGRKLRYVLAD